MEQAGGGAFGKDLIEDVIPYVEKTFRTLPGADNRALGGLSMGGGQTAAIGFAHPELFRALVIMSAGIEQRRHGVSGLLQRSCGDQQTNQAALDGRGQGRHAGRPERQGA